MKRVNIEKLGRQYIVEVPDDSTPETWPYGVIVGPPDLSSLGLPPSIEMRLHNELAARGLIESKNVRKRIGELEAALKAALRIDVQKLHELYIS